MRIALGHCELSVAEEVGDLEQALSLLCKIGRGGVPQVVEAKPLHLGLSEGLLPSPCKFSRHGEAFGTARREDTDLGPLAHEARELFYYRRRKWKCSSLTVFGLLKERDTALEVDVTPSEIDEL